MLPAVIRAIYPASCMGCGEATDRDDALCGSCWRETPFIVGLCCDGCGAPLPGDDTEAVLCDECMTTARPWQRGRAALAYRDLARRLVLRLKHGDRTELARPLSAWMATVARPLVTADTVIVPVPLHRLRLFSRRYNQAALLAQGVGRALGHTVILDALTRTQRTPSLNGMSRDDRFKVLDGALTATPHRRSLIAGKDILLVDDVMTTGATLAAATEALHDAGAKAVCTVTLARAVKDD